jgi:hypothetical protein
VHSWSFFFDRLFSLINCFSRSLTWFLRHPFLVLVLVSCRFSLSLSGKLQSSVRGDAVAKHRVAPMLPKIASLRLAVVIAPPPRARANPRLLLLLHFDVRCVSCASFTYFLLFLSSVVFSAISVCDSLTQSPICSVLRTLPSIEEESTSPHRLRNRHVALSCRCRCR